MLIMTVVGNRPQFIKAAAVNPQLEGRVEQILIHTGQHYDHALSQVFFDELGLGQPDHNLGVGSGTHAEQTGRLMLALESAVAEHQPDALLFYGDTNSTLAAAVVAAKAGIPAAHVEAGVRSFDRSTPEEVNRVVADVLSGLLLCPTVTAVQNLSSEGMADRARLTGDVMADVAARFGEVAERRSEILEQVGVEPGGYLLATAHRASNVDEPEQLESVIEILAAACELAPVVFPVHPRTQARLEATGLIRRIRQLEPELIAVEALGYFGFARLLRSALAVITDAGGVQKEAYMAGVPCVTLRHATEWVETVDSGWNRLVGLSSTDAVESLRALIDRRSREAPEQNVFGDAGAGKRVADEVLSWLG